ncbi:MAG: PTS glucitol/sorbitol transporter subunit IIA [Gemella sp.]|nr:PTS glucitol/sorbitol transporter subunit IIA [Gemella sp.]
MVVIYENVIKNKGDLVGEFGSAMFITFGDSAPDTLKDYCYSIDVKETSGRIAVGQYLNIDGEKFEILKVGEIAEQNLVSLGHLTVNFDGGEEVLPGAISVDAKDCPKLDIGTVLKIEEQ